MVIPISDPASQFILSIAANLATDLLKAGYGWLRDKAIGNEEQRALQDVWLTAFITTLEILAETKDGEQLKSIAKQLDEFIKDEGTADLLLEQTLEQIPLDPLILRKRYRQCFPQPDVDFDFDNTIMILSDATLTALDEQARKQNSPLFNRLMVARHPRPPSGRQLVREPEITPIHIPFSTYSRQIKAFIKLYLGTPEQPVPFGGRTEELQALDDWLLGQHQPPNALIVAPGGSGKSALMVRWLDSVQRRDLGHVVFVPVSIRYSTASRLAFFSSLAAGLAAAHNDPAVAQQPGIDPRDVCIHLLERKYPASKPLLVVLDGLDEATGWELDQYFFPEQPSPHLRILVTARSVESKKTDRGWRKQLGWESPELARSISLKFLTRQGIAQVLAEMGDPLAGLAPKKDEIIDVLYHLSDQGDPLLVGLYVLRLREEGEAAGNLSKSDLEAMEPGLEGYFKLWAADLYKLWGDQPDIPKSIQHLFNLLAVALGPLLRKDIDALTEPADQVGWQSIDSGLAQIRRWIVGDGEADGYVFQHPRLTEYFHDRMYEWEHPTYEQRFIKYGERILGDLENGSRQPKNAPAYVLQYYAEHLEQVKAEPGAYYALICKGWLKAWYELERAYSGFLSDARRAWQLADQLFSEGKEISRSFGIQLRCALAQSSVTALSSNIPPELLASAFQIEILTATQVLVYVSTISNDGQKAEALMVIAPFLEAQIEAALKAALSIGDEYYRARAVIGLAPHLPVSLMPQALEAALAIGDEYYRARALSRLAPHLPEALMPQALEAALAIGKEYDRAEALSGLAPHLPEALMPQALEAALAIGDEYARAEALSGLAPHLPEALMPQALEAALGAALGAALAIGKEYARARALSGLAPHLPEALMPQALEAALEAALATEYEGDRGRALSGLAPHLPEALMPQALEAALAIGDEDDRERALSGLAPHLPEALLPQALEAAQAIGKEYARARALSGLAPHLPEALMPQALEAALAIGKEYDRAEALSGLAPHLPDALKPKALEAALAIGDEYARARALSGLAPHLPDALKPKALEAALEAALAIGDEYARAEALSGLAPHLPDALKPKALEAALGAALAIGKEYARARALSGLAPHLPNSLKPKALEAALEAAQAIGDEYARARALSGLAPHLPEALMPQALEAALEAVLAIGDEYAQAEALSGLAPHLPVSLMPQALELALAIGKEYARAETLSGLAPHLPEALMPQALEAALGAALAIGDEYYRARALSGLAPHLPEALMPQALEAALEAALEIGDEYDRERALSGLALHLPEALMPQALEAALAIGNEYARAEALSGLAPHLPEAIDASGAGGSAGDW